MPAHVEENPAGKLDTLGTIQFWGTAVMGWPAWPTTAYPDQFRLDVSALRIGSTWPPWAGISTSWAGLAIVAAAPSVSTIPLPPTAATSPPSLRSRVLMSRSSGRVL